MRELPVIQPGRPFAPSGAPPVFDKIGIVGLGLIGGSIGLAARARWPGVRVVGIDSRDILVSALALGAAAAPRNAVAHAGATIPSASPARRRCCGRSPAR